MNDTMTNTTLTDSQRQTLEYAIDRGAGRIEWFPQHIKGAIRNKVVAGLQARGLALDLGGSWTVTDAAYDALGRERPPRAAANDETRISKQAVVIALLRRPQGVTMKEICHTTGWIEHTVRGLFSGTLRKRLGLTVGFDKRDDGVRVYHIVEVQATKAKRRVAQAH